MSSVMDIGQDVSGTYNWKEDIVGGRPIHAREDGKFCLMFYNH